MDRTRRWLVAGGMLLAAVTSQADDQPAPAPAGVSSEQSDSISVVFDSATPISTASLGELTGKARIEVEKIQVNDQDLNGVVTDNVAIDNQTGHNTISTGAYQDAAGFITTIQNTGNNVLIQNATIINLTVEP